MPTATISISYDRIHGRRVPLRSPRYPSPSHKHTRGGTLTFRRRRQPTHLAIPSEPDTGPGNDDPIRDARGNLSPPPISIGSTLFFADATATPLPTLTPRRLHRPTTRSATLLTSRRSKSKGTRSRPSGGTTRTRATR